MKQDNIFDEAVSVLKDKYIKVQNPTEKIYREVKEIIDNKENVINRFNKIFSPENVSQITEADFRDFLLFEHNKHWTGLHRTADRICSDIELLRTKLKLLFNEEIDIVKRLNDVIKDVKGLGKAIITAILLVEYPDKYGVWNGTSEAGLKILDLWPKFERKESFGERYVKINNIFLELAKRLKIDLWTLDALWWVIGSSDGNDGGEGPLPPGETKLFTLERYLHEFLLDNWSKLPLGKEWAIYSEPGDEEAGYEYSCGKIGRIDLLVKHRSKPKWLIIELKRNKTSDHVVGQILRYIGWVKENLAQPGETVEGLIIAHEADETIKYAIKAVENIKLNLYEIDFNLKDYDI